MNVAQKIAEKAHRLALMISRIVRSVRSPAENALGVALIPTPYHAVAASGGETSTSVSANAVPANRHAGSDDAAIRSFSVNFPQAALDDLSRRLLATRWPDKETAPDRAQGAQLAEIQELVRYWGSGYDWRKAEAKLNALPQFMTNIDGLGIHFIHVRSRHPNALPLIITHGWPGSVFEQIKLVGPLTDPTTCGGGAGHFAAWEEPGLFAAELRAAFRSLR